jgi:hypothetical protein
VIHSILLAAATTIAAVAAPPHAPDGTYAYTITAKGTTIGTTSITMRSGAGGVSVQENITYTAPVAVTAVATTQYDTALHETAYSGDFKLPSGSQHTGLTIKPGNVHVDVPGQSVDLPADPSAPLELADDHLLALHTMLPAILHATGAKRFTLAVLAGGQTVVATVVDGAALPPAPASAKPGDGTLTIDVAGLRITYWFDPRTYLLHAVAIPKQNVEFRLNG